MSVAISFAVRTDLTPDAQEATWAAIRWVRGVAAVSRLAPDSPDPELRSLGTAVVGDTVNANDLAAEIRALDGIAYADVAAQRGITP